MSRIRVTGQKEPSPSASGIKISSIHGPNVCAEDLVVAQLMGQGSSLNNIVMTPAIRPRTMEVVPVCHRCQERYTRQNFLPGTPHRPGGLWDMLK